MSIDYLGLVYAVFIAIGGIIGYVKADSIASLVSGLVFGAVLTFGAYRISVDNSDVYISLISSIILMILMGIRSYTTQKFIPAGLIAVISLLMVMKLSYQWFNTYHQFANYNDRNAEPAELSNSNVTQNSNIIA